MDLERLCMHHKGLRLYRAGLPGFPANFTRDSIIAGWLLNDRLLLNDQIVFSGHHQAEKDNPEDGAEPGKVHHEIRLETMRGVRGADTEGLRERPGFTTYNACDTTALYLLGHELLAKHAGLHHARAQKNHITAAVRYIFAHLEDGLFTERPPPGAERYCLKVTYWKDSALLGRDEAEYPIVYTLAHAQNMQGLRSARAVLNSIDWDLDEEERELLAAISPAMARMRAGLHRLFDEKNGCFVMASGAGGDVEGVSSDSLHALAYLHRKDVPRGWRQRIVDSAAALETSIGYRCLAPEFDSSVQDNYHADTVWPVEQALIHIGAKRHGLAQPLTVTSRIAHAFARDRKDHELFAPDQRTNRYLPAGQHTQLWSIAAKEYFSRYA